MEFIFALFFPLFYHNFSINFKMSCRIPPLIQVRIDLIGHFDQQIGPILLELEGN